MKVKGSYHQCLIVVTGDGDCNEALVDDVQQRRNRLPPFALFELLD